jgi:hypothetical protein
MLRCRGWWSVSVEHGTFHSIVACWSLQPAVTPECGQGVTPDGPVVDCLIRTLTNKCPKLCRDRNRPVVLSFSTASFSPAYQIVVPFAGTRPEPSLLLSLQDVRVHVRLAKPR